MGQQPRVPSVRRGGIGLAAGLVCAIWLVVTGCLNGPAPEVEQAAETSGQSAERAEAGGTIVMEERVSPEEISFPWRTAAYRDLQSFHAVIWSHSATDRKNFRDILRGRRELSPVVSELWYRASPPRIRIDFYSATYNPSPPGRRREFDGLEGGSRMFEGQPLELYRRILQTGDVRRSFNLRRDRTVYNRRSDGPGSEAVSIYRFVENSETAPEATLSRGLKLLDVPPFLFESTTPDSFRSYARAQRRQNAERLAAMLAGMTERQEWIGRPCARYVHPTVVQTELRDDLVDLEFSIGLVGHLRGWARESSLNPPWTEDICLYRFVELSTDDFDEAVFEVW